MATDESEHAKNGKPPQTLPTASSDGVAASRRSSVQTAVIRDDWSGRCTELRLGGFRLAVHQQSLIGAGVWCQPGISWGSPGLVSIDEAEDMAAVLSVAIELANQWQQRSGERLQYPVEQGTTP